MAITEVSIDVRSLGHFEKETPPATPEVMDDARPNVAATMSREGAIALKGALEPYKDLGGDLGDLYHILSLDLEVRPDDAPSIVLNERHLGAVVLYDQMFGEREDESGEVRDFQDHYELKPITFS